MVCSQKTHQLKPQTIISSMNATSYKFFYTIIRITYSIYTTNNTSHGWNVPPLNLITVILQIIQLKAKRLV